jgi:peptide/nickel transport system substrate-binding protein
MQSLIDQPAYISRIQQGYGTPTYGPVPAYPQTSFLSPAEKSNPYPYSPAAARQLLTSHGWTIPASGPATCAKAGSAAGECGAGIAAGTKLVIPLLYSSGFPSMDDEVQAMQSAFSSSGIQLSLRQAPFNTVLAQAYGCPGKTTATCPASSPALSLLAAPTFTYVPIIYPAGETLFACSGTANGGNYCNKQVDGLISKATTEPGAAGVAALYAYQLYLAKQLPVLWFPNSAYQMSVISPKLGGINLQDSTAHIYPSYWSLKS